MKILAVVCTTAKSVRVLLTIESALMGVSEPAKPPILHQANPTHYDSALAWLSYCTLAPGLAWSLPARLLRLLSRSDLTQLFRMFMLSTYLTCILLLLLWQLCRALSNSNIITRFALRRGRALVRQQHKKICINDILYSRKHHSRQCMYIIDVFAYQW